MRVVVDSNRKETAELADFLSASGSNRAVVTDWLMMEAYRGAALTNLYRSMGVLGRFPRQVVVLKNTGACMRTRVGLQMANRLIWRKHTKTFPAFVEELRQAERGDRLIEGSLADRREAANGRLEELLRHADDIFAHQRALLHAFTERDLRCVRGAVDRSPRLLERIVAASGAVAVELRGAVGDVPEPAPVRYFDDFVFRVGLSQVSWFLEWTRRGGSDLRRGERIRNSYVDVMISTYGTYFNGVMSGDVELNAIHDLSRALLGLMGARLPPPYSGPPRDAPGSR